MKFWPWGAPLSLSSFGKIAVGKKAEPLDIWLELIASDGAFKTNPSPPPDEIQADTDFDDVEYVDSLDRVYRFPSSGNQIQYVIPIRQGFSVDAPDSEAESFFVRSAMLNLTAAAGMNRDAFSVFFRIFTRDAGPGVRPIFYMWNAQAPPNLTYASTFDSFEVKYPVTPFTTHVLDNAPIHGLFTVVMRYDGDAVYSDLYGGDDGVTLLDSKQTLSVGSMTSASDVIGFGGTGPATNMKRMAILQEFVSGPRLVSVLEQFVTDDPLV